MNPAAYGRYGDNTMVHMNNEEVAGLASLAKSMGRELTTNPVTGYPEAFSLRDALPTLVGLGASVASGGTLSPLMMGALVGGTTAATTGSLEQGLMSGLTAGAMTGVTSALAGPDPTATLGGAPMPGASPVPPPAASPVPPVGPSVPPGAVTTASGAPLAGPTGMAGAMPPIEGASPVLNAPTNAFPGTVQGPGGTPLAVNPMEKALAGQTQFNPSEGVGRIGRMAGNVKTMFSDPSGQRLGQFVSDQKLNLAMAGAGKAGEMQYAAQQEMEDKKEAMDAAKAAKLKATQDSIRRSYANVGRALPMNPYTGRPVFAEGGIVGLMGGGRPFDSAPAQMTPEQAAFLKALMGGSTDIKDLGDKAKAAAGKAAGGYLETGGRVGDGMSDDIPAMIDGDQPAALSDGEFVIPADVVSHLGNGSSDAGAQQLYSMMDRIRQARTGNKEQGKEINAKKYMPA
jgi:hypothetical protein